MYQMLVFYDMLSGTTIELENGEVDTILHDKEGIKILDIHGNLYLVMEINTM